MVKCECENENHCTKHTPEKCERPAIWEVEYIRGCYLMCDVCAMAVSLSDWPTVRSIEGTIWTKNSR